jgi:hypothetical protein
MLSGQARGYGSWPKPVAQTPQAKYLQICTFCRTLVARSHEQKAVKGCRTRQHDEVLSELVGEPDGPHLAGNSECVVAACLIDPTTSSP